MSETRLSRRELVATAAVLPLVAAVSATPAHADQPRMQEALNHLQRALDSLQRASADKGGHRVEAIRLVRAAIVQVERGIEFARNNS
jgi:hypothetical protein